MLANYNTPGSGRSSQALKKMHQIFSHFKFEGIDIQEAFELLHCLKGYLRTKSRPYKISLQGLCGTT